MRVAWLTDIHLNFLDDDGRREFLASVAAGSPDAVLISGDVAQSDSIVSYLEEIERAVRCPIYFVLGNHDFYHGSIARTRAEIGRLADRCERLCYLSAAEVVELTETTALVGHDGWGDARLGNYQRSPVLLNDFFLIEEFKSRQLGPHEANRLTLEQTLNALGDEAAGHFARVLPEALRTHRRVVALTHVPPFREAAWHGGRFSDDDWLPFFACKAVGDVIREAIQRRPDREVLVLCGHTHGSGQARVLQNLEVLTGGAEYRHPAIQQIFELD